MNDPVDHATGLEKKELLAHLAGNDDPFHVNAIKRGVATKENPTLVPSAFDARIVGCICKLNERFIGRLWLCYLDYNSLSILSQQWNRPRRSNARFMDVVASGYSKTVWRMRQLVQIIPRRIVRDPWRQFHCVNSFGRMESHFPIT